MKERLAVALVFFATCGVSSLQAGELEVHNGLGVFFSETEFTDETSNTTLAFGGSVTAYLVLIHADVAQVGGYECAIDDSEPDGLLILSKVIWPAGGINGGGQRNHIVTFDPPIAVAPSDAVVLCTLDFTVFTADPVDIMLGPSTPWGLPGWDGPVIVGVTADDRRPAFLTSGISGEGMQVVATINGDGVTSAEGRTWSQVKGLFQ